MTDDAPSSPREEERPDEDRPERNSGREEEAEEPEGEPDEERKPISVRDLMPGPPTRRPAPERDRRTPRPAEPPEEPADDETAEAAAGPTADEAAPSRPTPVRVAMDAPPPGDSRPAEALPSRRFEAEGREWIVRITGRTITGTRPDAGALLMQLRFYDAGNPERPLRELLTVDRPLDALYQEDLRELLDRSRPADGEERRG